MSYTLKQLTLAYTAVHGGIEPTGTALADLQNRAAQNAAGSMTDAQVMSWVLNSADNSTALAALSYQFFTGKSPTQQGLAFLVNSADNGNDLNDSYYAQFNTENRYINFAANLGVHGEGADTFAAKYGAMTFAEYIASIYETIVGTTYATAAGIDQAAAIAYLIASQDALLATAKSSGMITAGMTQAQIDLALKAAAAGFLLAEAIKADVGVYAGAANNFMLAVATNQAVYNTDITQTYTPTPSTGQGTGQPVTTAPSVETTPGYEPPPPPPVPPAPPAPSNRSFTLTVGNDTFTGGAGNDTFTGTDLTFSDNDVLKGGDGHDTLTITATITNGNSWYSTPNNGTSSIETVNITSNVGASAYIPGWADVTALNMTAAGGLYAWVNANAAVDATTTQQGTNNITVNGGTNVTVTSAGATTGTIQVGSSTSSTKPTGDVVINRELVGGNTGGAITVYGGKTVSVTQTAVTDPVAAQTNGAVRVYGSTLTTEVTVKAAPTLHSAPYDRDAASVTIEDAFAGIDIGTITKVSVDGYTTLYFAGTALSDLSLARGSGTTTIDNSGLSSGNVTTLNLKVDGVTGGAVADIGVYRTLNVTTGATGSTVDNLNFSAVRTLNVSGDTRLLLSSATGLNHLETVTISGAAALVADLSGATVTAVTASGTGANYITLDASHATFTGGAGVDRLTLTATDVTKAIALGGGDDRVIFKDTITSLSGTIDGGAGRDGIEIQTAFAATLSAQTHTFLNFETVQLLGQTSETVDLSTFGATIDTVVTTGQGVVTLTSVAAVTALTTVSVNGTGLAGDFTGSSVATVNASNTLGAVTLTLDGSKTAFVGGSGVDTITMAATTVSKAIDLGGGADKLDLTNATGVTAALNGGAGTDTLVMTASLAATLGGQTNSIINFDVLELSGASGQTINVNGIGDFASIKATGAALTLTSNSEMLDSLDASALTGNFTWTATQNGSETVTVKGSATARNTVDLTAMDGVITYTGGAGTDTITIGGGSHAIDLGSAGSDSVIITSAASDNGTPLYATVTGFGYNDSIMFMNVAGGSQSFLGGPTATESTLEASLNSAAAGNGGTTAVATWFQYDGATYVVIDNSAANTFQAGTDYVVKLTGLIAMQGSSFYLGSLDYSPPS